MKLLAAVCDYGLEPNKSMGGGPREDISFVSTIQPATAALISQELIIATDGQSAALAKSPSTIPALDDPRRPQQTVEVANDKQEWDICDILGKEDVDGEAHYWVEWCATLVPKCDMRGAEALIARFEAKLRAKGRKRGRKG
jgi:hypothetical protein